MSDKKSGVSDDDDDGMIPVYEYSGIGVIDCVELHPTVFNVS